MREIWVVHRPTGRIGLLTDETSRKSVVQFGSGGPVERVWTRDIRAATPEEIKEVTGT